MTHVICGHSCHKWSQFVLVVTCGHTFTGLGYITSHRLREYEIKKLRSPACCRQENEIFSPHSHATDGK